MYCKESAIFSMKRQPNPRDSYQNPYLVYFIYLFISH